ncbi:hypothetical protein [Sphingomonas bacterium]|uniref:hypothetical protein n=1 Tax=Sphingomonas bacterium TaxID=1895847 RepID=UPI001576E814|nr:hypothetical protein [Sphingomonas bacterium]
MRLLPAGSVRLDLERPWSISGGPTSRLVRDGRRTDCVVDGEVLQAAIGWGGRLVLLNTDGIDYEDALHIYLIDRDDQVLDRASLSAAYSTGTFDQLELLAPDKIRFRFFNQKRWVIELFDKARVALPWSEPQGVHRPFGLSRRFRVSAHSLDRPGEPGG